MAQKRIPVAEDNKVPAAERIASSIKRLAATSTELKVATGELGQALSSFDKALQTLNLVPAWHKVAGHEDEHGNYWTRDIGYTKVQSEWGIALRRTRGNEFSGDHEEEVWRFNAAPHWMQIESLSKIPDLHEELIKRTEETINKIKAKTVEANELATALNAALIEDAW
ncbi:MAG TPA: hypothetical protein VN841_14225 [Bryobacteraceae bacterium]|nr:hypothetical protein [Bryobacteraceae bacterium]